MHITEALEPAMKVGTSLQLTLSSCPLSPATKSPPLHFHIVFEELHRVDVVYSLYTSLAGTTGSASLKTNGCPSYCSAFPLGLTMLISFSRFSVVGMPWSSTSTRSSVNTGSPLPPLPHSALCLVRHLTLLHNTEASCLCYSLNMSPIP